MENGFFFTDSDLIVRSSVSCFGCRLSQGCSSPRMEPTGDGHKRILVVAEAPGKTEDEKKTQLIGQAGQVIRKVFKKHGIDLDKDCWKTYAVTCRPPENRTPTDAEIAACRPQLWKTIEKYKPHVIILLGGVAMDSFLQHRWFKDIEGISRWRGWAIPDREAGAWVIPTFHPRYVDRAKKQPVVRTIFEADIALALSYLDKPFPTYKEEKSCIQIITNENELSSLLESLYRKARRNRLLTAFDYEATGLKPYVEGHKIKSASICMDPDEAFSFLWPNSQSPARHWWGKILATECIPKTAHNIKFEDTWSLIQAGVRVQGWKWCSMQGAHLKDNRPHINSIDFQNYVNFGLEYYGASVKPYLKGKNPKDGNSFNTIDQAPVRDLLLYGGIDSLTNYRLAVKQMKEVYAV